MTEKNTEDYCSDCGSELDTGGWNGRCGSCADLAEQSKRKDLVITEQDLCMFRQWFDSVQDCNPEYLQHADYVLAEKLYERLGMRVPNSITEKI